MLFGCGNAGYRCFSVDKDAFTCDLYGYEEGKMPFCGEYMEQYRWGEERKAYLMMKEYFEKDGREE